MADFTSLLQMFWAMDELLKESVPRFWRQRAEADPIAALSPRLREQLFFIRRSQPCSLNEVMAATNLSAPAASAAVDKLVRAGLVRREVNAEDRREVRIWLEPEISRSLDELRLFFQQRLAECLGGCSPEEAACIERAAALVEKQLRRPKR